MTKARSPSCPGSPAATRDPVGRNASKTEPARLLAVFVVDPGDTPRTIPTTPSEPTE